MWEIVKEGNLQLLMIILKIREILNKKFNDII